MNRHISTLLIFGALLVAAFAVAPAIAQVPEPPQAFYGTAEVNGSPAPVGAQIEARGAGVMNGIQGNPIAVTVAGRYGGRTIAEPKLGVQGTIEANAPIEFFIDGVKAQVAVPGGAWQDSYAYQSGVVTELNLRVATQAPPTSTPTATATVAAVVTVPTSTPTQPPTQTPTTNPSPTPAVQASTNTPLPTAVPATSTPMPATPIRAAPSPTPPPTMGPAASAPAAATTRLGSPTPPAAAALPGPTGTLPQPEPATPSSPPAPLGATVQPTAQGVEPAAQAAVSTPTPDTLALAAPAATSEPRSELATRAPRPTRGGTTRDGSSQSGLLAVVAIGSLVAALLVIVAMIVLVLRARG